MEHILHWAGDNNRYIITLCHTPAALAAEHLQQLGMKVVNEGISDQVCHDRQLLTGDSPLAANNLGILAADVLLNAAAG